MILKEQKPIRFINKAEVIVDEGLLKMAMLSWADYFYGKPIAGRKVIFLYGQYPAVAIHKDKVHVHRLLFWYTSKKSIRSNQYVHHKDGNKLNANMANLELLTASNHQAMTNRGRKQSSEHVRKRINATTLTRYGHELAA